MNMITEKVNDTYIGIWKWEFHARRPVEEYGSGIQIGNRLICSPQLVTAAHLRGVSSKTPTTHHTTSDSSNSIL